jgi:ubiquinone/menaquinone biosynthesis C-methylase UbiE
MTIEEKVSADEELARLKDAARHVWAAGDYPEIARRTLWPVGERIVERLAVRPGEDVLDVACGTGNAALRAAHAGARVVGVDITPELLEAGRSLAAAEGVEVQWVEGDAEALPLAGDSFDVVVSTFGCMFAPRHAVTAREIARVLRPGGRLGICAWTPEGAMGRFFARMAAFGPPPSPLAEPPVLWGSEPHVTSLFAGTGIELAFARETLDPPEFESTDAALEFLSSKFGPVAMARRATEAAGRGAELEAELRAFLEAGEPGEYLVATGRMRR